MTPASKLDNKITAIRSVFSALIGAKLVWYDTAELLLEDGSWDPWLELPIRLHTDTEKLVAIAWSQFDDLWIGTDSSLHFSFEGSTIRWVKNSVDKINAGIGSTIRSVLIGRGETLMAGMDVESWTRLLAQLDELWLEVFNALDENGYELHVQKPPGDFVLCI